MAKDEEINSIKIDNALNKQTLGTMQEDIKMIKESLTKLLEKFEELPNKFTTKNEHLENSKRIGRIESGFLWIIGIVGTAIITAILKVIGLLGTK